MTFDINMMHLSLTMLHYPPPPPLHSLPVDIDLMKSLEDQIRPVRPRALCASIFCPDPEARDPNTDHMTGEEGHTRGMRLFSLKLRCATGICPRDLEDYGCSCRYESSGNPVDPLDSCCEAHRVCYQSAAPCRRTLIPLPNNSTCSAANSSCDAGDLCEQRFCECDHAAIDCMTRSEYNSSLKNLHESFCTAENQTDDLSAVNDSLSFFLSNSSFLSADMDPLMALNSSDSWGGVGNLSTPLPSSQSLLRTADSFIVTTSLTAKAPIRPSERRRSSEEEEERKTTMMKRRRELQMSKLKTSSLLCLLQQEPRPKQQQQWLKPQQQQHRLYPQMHPTRPLSSQTSIRLHHKPPSNLHHKPPSNLHHLRPPPLDLHHHTPPPSDLLHLRPPPSDLHHHTPPPSDLLHLRPPPSDLYHHKPPLDLHHNLHQTSSQTSSIRPPSSQTSSIRPPSSHTSSIRPPSSQTSSIRPPSSHTSSTRPPSSHTSSIRPPSSQTSSIRPPSSQTSSIRPPSSHTSSIKLHHLRLHRPPSSQSSSTRPPSSHTSSIRPPSSQTSSIRPPSSHTSSIKLHHLRPP
ncbi:hypothetical protein F7725_010964 [Dissostichus mawsoni]|uniref:Phospholipase A2-like central domain-containing protein n=1 Tax=Dissostichus mawsoni TaxID=36200 RepID=A0A7J5Z894_DISMA|nr:hypothetical protein F7725_010964 [Dissostichus mawsoni]